jgi:short-subunit dehydrogenase
MKVENSVALITGSNQGIGRGFVEVLLQRGVKKIYATARRVETLQPLVAEDPQRVVPVALDINNTQQRRAVGDLAGDVTLLINNAGIPGSDQSRERRFLGATSMDDARAVMETDYWAQAEMCRVFAPQMVARGSGAIINILSIGALFCLPEYASYCAAKAAAAIMTKGVRAELWGTGVFVAGVYTGGVDTRMSAKNPQSQMSPPDHARQVLDAMEAGVEDIFAGARVEQLRDAIFGDAKAFEHQHAERFRREQAAKADTATAR